MNELIKVAGRQIGDDMAQTVNARDLHSFLGISRDFNQWLREQIARARLVEDRDYLTYEDVAQLPSGAKRRKECALALDAAKHIAMLSGSDKGFEVREYFIECERRAKSAAAFAIPQTLPEALRLAADESERAGRAEAALAVAAPKADALDRIATAEGSLCARDAAKALQLRPTDFTRWLQAHQWVYRRAGHAPLIAYQDKIQLGYLEHKVTTVTRTDGSDKVVEQVRITPKGLARLAMAIRADIALAA